MIALIRSHATAVEEGLKPDTEFIRAAVDFIKTYADRLRHGKEEISCSGACAKKKLSPEHTRIR